MILVTGVAGFIGMHVVRRLLADGRQVVGVDSLGPCPDPALRGRRLALLLDQPGFSFVQADLADAAAAAGLFAAARFEWVIHLAAQTGVRQSADQPLACVMNNLVGFVNLLEGCRNSGPAHLVYASSSSVYGANGRLPFSEQDPADHPLSLYGATKRSDELLAHSYSHLYRLPATGLRFFTVYGPWGRPDMAPMLFARAIMCGEPIEVYDQGRMLRDFTCVDDVAEAVVRLAAQPATPDPGFDPLQPSPAASCAPHRVYNVGNQQPVLLSDFIDALELALGRKAQRLARPRHEADMRATCADTRALQAALDWTPHTPLATGIARFVRWYESYHA
jgi:UDP-glucuronate 4-epimerase